MPSRLSLIDPLLNSRIMVHTSEGEGKGKDEPVKREKIGRRRIALIFPFLPPFLRPATQATNIFHLGFFSFFFLVNISMPSTLSVGIS